MVGTDGIKNDERGGISRADDLTVLYLAQKFEEAAANAEVAERVKLAVDQAFANPPKETQSPTTEAEVDDVVVASAIQDDIPKQTTDIDYSTHQFKRSGYDSDLADAQGEWAKQGFCTDDKNHKYFEGGVGDGYWGDVSAHAQALSTGDVNVAHTHLAEDALLDRKISGADIMRMQASMNLLGQGDGRVNGVFDEGLANNLAQYLSERPTLVNSVSPQMMGLIASHVDMDKLGNSLEGIHIRQKLEETIEQQQSNVQSQFSTASYGETGYTAELMNSMQAYSHVRECVTYVEKCIAETYPNLDAKAAANQFYAESGFNADAVGPERKGVHAKGISQMLPEEGRKYGLTSPEDFLDPEKSIEAGLAYMNDLTERYGDQGLATIAYNGGGDAVEYGRKHYNRLVDEGKIADSGQFTAREWHQAITIRNQELGPVSPDQKHLWRHETYNYIAKIMPSVTDHNNLVASAPSAAPSDPTLG